MWSASLLSFAFHLLRWGKMAKQMGNHYFKWTTKWMRCYGSQFPHKLLKGPAVVGQKTLHQLDRRWAEWKTAHCFFFHLVSEAPGVSERIYCARSIRQMCRLYPLLFFLTPLPRHDKACCQEGKENRDQYCHAFGEDYSINPQNLPIFLLLAITEDTRRRLRSGGNTGKRTKNDQIRIQLTIRPDKKSTAALSVASI